MRWLSSIFVFIVAAALASGASAATLTISIAGAGEIGDVRGMVFRDKDSFEKRDHPVFSFIVSSFLVAAQSGRATVVLPGLPVGRYAVATFQDRTGDGILHKNLFGAPTEPYGFSNDATGFAGPPSFEDAAVVIDDRDLSIEIHLR